MKEADNNRPSNSNENTELNQKHSVSLKNEK